MSLEVIGVCPHCEQPMFFPMQARPCAHLICGDCVG